MGSQHFTMIGVSKEAKNKKGRGAARPTIRLRDTFPVFNKTRWHPGAVASIDADEFALICHSLTPNMLKGCSYIRSVNSGYVKYGKNEDEENKVGEYH